MLEHGGVYVVRTRRGVSEVCMDSGTEFEWGDRKVVGERRVFGVEGDRMSFGLEFQVEEMVEFPEFDELVILISVQNPIRRTTP